jgi:hypothetical protein
MHISEDKIKSDIDKITTYRDKNERLSWKRKKDKIEALAKELEPIEDEIRRLIVEKRKPLLDEVEDLRAIMIKECIHPRDQLVHYGTHVECKFCLAKIGVVDTRNYDR